MSGKRKQYTPEYREQSVRLVIETGSPIAHVAKEIGVSEQLLSKWVAQAKARNAGNQDRALDPDERAELERVRQENSELRLDREFLKKAAAYAGDRRQVWGVSSLVSSSR